MQPANVLNRELYVGALIMLLGCAAADQDSGRTHGPICPATNPSCVQTLPPTGGSTAMQPQAPAQGGSFAQPPAGGTQSPPVSSGTGAGVPCNVAQIVSSNCTLCHTAQPKFGAPMPLMTLADFQAPARSNPQRKVFELASERITTSQVNLRMPPASNDPMAPADITAFNSWLTGGAVGVASGACAITADPGTTAMAGSGGTGQPPVPGSGLSLEPIEYNDPMMQCYELRAHAQGNKSQPYSVPTTPDHYVNFHFMPEFDAMRYVRSYRLLLDNDRVVHHWLFFRNVGAKTDGAVENSSGTHPDGELQHGWAPGGGDIYFQPDVGPEMPHDTSYTLELHYNNTTGGAAPDSTGIEVCVTPTKPQNVAILSWLGTDAIVGPSAQGTCDPTTNDPIHIIAGTPHMHTKGTHMKVVLNRAGGGQEVIHDAAFDFNYQVVYPANVMVMQGDTITTTCTYNQPATFGPGTDSEMCYWFAMHYPAFSLVNNNPLWSTLHGTNTCLE